MDAQEKRVALICCGQALSRMAYTMMSSMDLQAVCRVSRGSAPWTATAMLLLGRSGACTQLDPCIYLAYWILHIGWMRRPKMYVDR